MRLFSFLLIAWLTVGCATQNQNHYSELGDKTQTEERRILVTFVDRTINRNLPGNSQDQYQTRASYSNSAWSEGVTHQLAERYQIRPIAQWPMSELGLSCVVFEIPATLSVSNVLTKLKQEKSVITVETMQSYQVLANSEAMKPAYSDPYLNLQTAFNTLNIAELHKKATGKGIRIALIDSGVDLQHPDLQGQVNYSENLAPTPADQNTADKHGTAVAGVLAAHANNGVGIAGIAPNADLLAFRACWPTEPGALASNCNSYTLALALNRAISMKSQIINLSLSGPEDVLLKMLIEKALSEGIIIVAAVPGKNQPGGFPANLPGVIAVSQTAEANSKQVAAPGKDILTTVPNGAYDFMTGNSFATPHVTGLIALLLELHPDWHSEQIKQQIQRQDLLSGWSGTQIH